MPCLWLDEVEELEQRGCKMDFAPRPRQPISPMRLSAVRNDLLILLASWAIALVVLALLARWIL
jgi:hypothetical protein